MRAAGIEFDVIAANVDERIFDGETPEAYVCRVAGDKARAVRTSAAGVPVLAADTVVVVDGAVLGKPVDQADARRMLRLLSGRTHQVMTGVALTTAGAAAELVTSIATTTVEFLPLSDAEIDWYVGTGEPMDKAGAYAIQGLASRFVTRIAGSYSNVVGLPVSLVWQQIVTQGHGSTT